MAEFTLTNNNNINYNITVKEGEGVTWKDAISGEVTTSLTIPAGEYVLIENAAVGETLGPYYIFLVGTGQSYIKSISKEDTDSEGNPITVKGTEEEAAVKMCYLGNLPTGNAPVVIDIKKDSSPIIPSDEEDRLNGIQSNQIWMYICSESTLTEGNDPSNEEDWSQELITCGEPYGEKVNISEIQNIAIGNWYSCEFNQKVYDNGDVTSTTSFTEGSPEETLYNIYFKAYYDDKYPMDSNIITLDGEYISYKNEAYGWAENRTKIRLPATGVNTILSKNLKSISPDTSVIKNNFSLFNITGQSITLNIGDEIEVDGIPCVVVYNQGGVSVPGSTMIYTYIAVMSEHGLAYYIGNGYRKGASAADLSSKQEDDTDYGTFYWGPCWTCIPEEGLTPGTIADGVGKGVLNTYFGLNHFNDYMLSSVREYNKVDRKTIWTATKQFIQYYVTSPEDEYKWFIPSNSENILIGSNNLQSKLKNLSSSYYWSSTSIHDNADITTINGTWKATAYANSATSWAAFESPKDNAYAVRLFRVF